MKRNTRMTLVVTVLALLLALVAFGCSGSSVSAPEDGDNTDGDGTDGDSDIQADGDTPADGDGPADGDTPVDGDAPADGDLPGAGYYPDVQAPEPGQIALTDGVLEGDYLIVDAVANGLTDTLGVAFRVYYDPTVLTLAGAELGDALHADAVILARQPKAGEAWIGVSNIEGKTSTVNSPTAVCRLQFTFITRRQTRLDIDQSPWRSLAADIDMNAQPVRFFGGWYGLPESNPGPSKGR